MNAQISSFIFLVVVVISCFAKLYLCNDFNNENPIKLVSDSLEDMAEHLMLSMMDEDDNLEDDLYNARLTRHSIEAIYQFGDSISDTGNYLCENPHCGLGRFPYGQSYFDKPTGRCSDGLLIVDYIAKYLNLPFIDPYLNKHGNFTHGANFAVSGATALSVSTLAAKNIKVSATRHSLSVQFGWFKSHLGSLYPDASECRHKLAKALFLVGEIGGNDFNNAILGGKPPSVTYHLVPEVIQIISDVVEELIGLGATRIAVPGNFPIGCMTVYLAKFKTNDPTAYNKLKCYENLNKFSEFYNHKLRKAIKKLRKRYPCTEIVYMDLENSLISILQNATALGFDKNAMLKACCGTGDNDYNFGGKSCGARGAVCKNPESYVNWDGFHLTGQAYHAMSKWLIRHTFDDISSVT